MAIKYLDEESSLQPPSEPTKTKGITYLDQEEPSQSKGSKMDIMGVAGKELASGVKDMMSPSFSLTPLNPMSEISNRIANAVYQESKRPILESSPFQGTKSKIAQSIAIDAGAFLLADTGIKLGSLSKDFLATKPFASDQELISNIASVSKKLYNKTVELLRPKDIADYLETQTTHPAVKEMSSIIKKSKSPEESISTINNTVNELFSKRAKLLADNNSLVEPTHIKALEDYIATTKMTDTQKSAMQKVLAEETGKIQWSKYDLLSAEKDKEYFQGMAQRVYNAGGMDELTTGVNQAYTVLAKGAKEVVEKVVPDVKPINSRYEGLMQGRTMLANLQKKIIENPDESLNVVADVIGRPSRKSALAAGVRKFHKLIPVVRDWGTYKHASGDIEKLNAESNALRAILEKRIKSSIPR